MEQGTPPERLLLAVSPTLLADVLWRALRFEGLEVDLYSTSEHHAPADSRYALAVVSEDLPADVAADVVIRLPEDADLPDVLELVEEALGVQLPSATGSSTA